MSQDNKKRKFSETLSDAIAYMGAYFTAEENLDHNMPETDPQRFYQKIHPQHTQHTDLADKIRKYSAASS